MGDQRMSAARSFLCRQWLGAAGIYGKPRHVYRLTLQYAPTYQRHAYVAMESNGKKELLYVCSTVHAQAPFTTDSALSADSNVTQNVNRGI